MNDAGRSISPEQALAARFGLRCNPFGSEAKGERQTGDEHLARRVAEVRATVLEGQLLTVITGWGRNGQSEFVDRLSSTFGETIRFLSLHGDKLNFAAPGSPTAAPAKLHQSIESIEFVVESAIRQATHIERAGLLVDHADALEEGSLLTLLDFVERFRVTRPPVQLVLVGAESMLPTLTDAVCARFGDLTARHFSLERVTREEARAMIAARLERAGATRELFPDAAVDAAHELTNGYADSLLALALWSLWLANEREAPSVTAELVREASGRALVPDAPNGSAPAPVDAGAFEVFQPGKLTAFLRPRVAPLSLPVRAAAGREPPSASAPGPRLVQPKWLGAAAAFLLLAVAFGWWQVDRWTPAPQPPLSETPANPEPREPAVARVEPAADEPPLEDVPALDPAFVERPALVDIPREAPASADDEAPSDIGGNEEVIDAPAAPAVPVEPSEDERIASLLDRAQDQLEARKLTTPAGDSARETYLEVLELDPSSAAARQGLERIETIYLRWAREAEADERWNEARIYYRRAQRLSPEDASLAEAVERVLEAERLAALPAAAGTADNELQDATLIDAARSNDADVIVDAIRGGAAVDARDIRGKTPVMWAAEHGELAVVRLLDEQGADLNLEADTGDTALMYAAQSGHADVVRYLIDHGAVVDQANGLGWTALMYAAVGGHDAAVRELLARGADVNALSQERKSPLMAAARNGHAEVVRSLADAGARLNQMDRSGWTALMYAAWQGHTDVADALLASDANLDVRNTDGQTALTLGIVRRNREVIDRLVQAGAQR